MNRDPKAIELIQTAGKLLGTRLCLDDYFDCGGAVRRDRLHELQTRVLNLGTALKEGAAAIHAHIRARGAVERVGGVEPRGGD